MFHSARWVVYIVCPPVVGHVVRLATCGVAAPGMVRTNSNVNNQSLLVRQSHTFACSAYERSLKSQTWSKKIHIRIFTSAAAVRIIIKVMKKLTKEKKEDAKHIMSIRTKFYSRVKFFLLLIRHFQWRIMIDCEWDEQC